MLKLLSASLIAVVLACTGCSDKPAAAPTSTAAAAQLPPSLFLTAEPTGAKDVKDAKDAAKVGEHITLRGRIGGSEEPFVSERAVFTIVDLHMKYCGEVLKDDHCKTPWDYCCEPADELAAHSATIQVTGPDNKPLKSGLNGVRGLKPLAIVTISGTVTETAEGNLIVKAEGIYAAQ